MENFLHQVKQNVFDCFWDNRLKCLRNWPPILIQILIRWLLCKKRERERNWKNMKTRSTMTTTTMIFNEEQKNVQNFIFRLKRVCKYREAILTFMTRDLRVIFVGERWKIEREFKKRNLAHHCVCIFQTYRGPWHPRRDYPCEVWGAAWRIELKMRENRER